LRFGGVGRALVLAQTHHVPDTLIVEGPYKLSRNPIYLAMLAMLIGYIATTGALSPVLLPLLFLRVFEKRFVEPEEAALRDAFGAEAERYLSRTRRWV